MKFILKAYLPAKVTPEFAEQDLQGPEIEFDDEEIDFSEAKETAIHEFRMWFVGKNKNTKKQYDKWPKSFQPVESYVWVEERRMKPKNILKAKYRILKIKIRGKERILYKDERGRFTKKENAYRLSETRLEHSPYE